MNIGGFQKFSLIDYPGKVAAVVFTQGCNFRCPWCHNPELVYPELFSPAISEQEIFSFLKNRRGRLEGVVVTGGEPTLQKDVDGFLRRVKDMGFAVKLDTNGATPFILGRLIEKGLVDYIAMDVKAPLEKYHKLSGVTFNTHIIRESIDIIMRSGVDYEFRTTHVEALLDINDMLNIGALVKDACRYTIQEHIHRSEKPNVEISENAPLPNIVNSI